ncbi:MAG: hypothetical protein AAFU67_08530, partial [Bacteroidota bacterium]
MQGLTFEYPVWFLILCVLAGLGVALLLYFRDNTFREQGRWLNWLLGGLRWLAYSFLATLLLSPLLKYLQSDQQDPIVVLAQDASESVALGTDSAAYLIKWKALSSQLGQNYQLVHYRFGDLVQETDQLDFSDKRTDLNAVLTEISDVYSNQNLGAVILATDGIYNEGANPVYNDLQIKAPIYTVGLGDTTQQRDLLIRRVFHNKIAYLNDRFSVQIDISARNAAGSNSRLTVSRVDGARREELHTESIVIDNNDFFTTREVILDADRPGVQRYRIRVSSVNDEASTTNNQRDFFVDILDARQKILLLAHAPHPDLSALRQSLLTGKNNEVEVTYAQKFAGDLRDYDLLVLHQLPSAKYPIEGLLSRMAELKKPTWFILGEATEANRFNAAQQLLRFLPKGESVNKVSGQAVPGFNLFTISEDLRAGLTQFPPLTAPFGDFAPGPNASVLLNQKIGRVETEYPLLIVGESSGTRTGVLAATDLWQWRLFDYLDNSNHDRYDELVSQVTQFLSVQEDKRRFRVSVAENLFDENEPIQLDAELYNSNYELINEPEATVVITDQEGREYNYTFNRTSNAYTLNAGILPVGNYRFRASTNASGEALTYDGRFSIQSVDVERFALEADHGLLRLLSDRYGGDFLLPADLGELPSRLEERGTVKPILFQTITTRSVINLKWIFFI